MMFCLRPFRAEWGQVVFAVQLTEGSISQIRDWIGDACAEPWADGPHVIGLTISTNRSIRDNLPFGWWIFQSASRGISACSDAMFRHDFGAFLDVAHQLERDRR